MKTERIDKIFLCKMYEFSVKYSILLALYAPECVQMRQCLNQ